MLKSLLDVEALKSFDPLPLPVDPEVKVTGIIAGEVTGTDGLLVYASFATL